MSERQIAIDRRRARTLRGEGVGESGEGLGALRRVVATLHNERAAPIGCFGPRQQIRESDLTNGTLKRYVTAIAEAIARKYYPICKFYQW